jgi:tRNA(fMet)-specific endonuclease VapC
MKYLLDTHICIALLRDSSEQVASHFSRAIVHGDSIALSSLVLCELWFGVYNSSRQNENAAKLRRFLEGFVEVIRFDDEDAQAAGKLRAELAKKGQTIGSYDTLIAGQCLCKQLAIVTSNTSEFSRVEGLRSVDWAK